MKLVTVLGTRPQFIKAAPIQRALEVHGIENITIDTGQHYDPEMAANLVAELGLEPPRINCAVGSGHHGAQTGRMLEAIEAALLELRPDRVMVYGDTNSTLAGALAAVKLQVPVAHVEAGLRSHDMSMPEEVNRVLTDRIADILFAPTDSAAAQLISEGRAPETIHIVGDVMLDAALTYAPDLDAAQGSVHELIERAPDKPLVLATVHRADNTREKPLAHIVEALLDLTDTYDVVLPLHPRTRSALESSGQLARLQDGLHVIAPCSYVQVLALVRCAIAVITDSGGLQKEAFFLQTPAITLRAETEWQELVRDGWNTLVPPGPGMAEPIQAALAATPPTPPSHFAFGDGRAALRIAETLKTLNGRQVGGSS